MSLRLCSILGTVVLALAVASPASASKKKKKSDDTSTAASASAASDVSATPAAGAKGKAKGKKAAGSKKKKKAEEPAPAETAIVPETAPVETNTWERPPVEQEKPVAPVVAAPVEKVVGDGRPWSVGLLAGWGFKTDRQTAGLGADPYGFAAGVRAGYSFDFKLYVGVFYTFFLGNSSTGQQARANVLLKTTHARYMDFGAEAGYDWWVGPVVVRPSLQIGTALSFSDVSGVNRRELTLLLGPGFTVFHPWDMFFLGGDARFVIATGNGASAFLVAATGGLRFE